MNSSNPEAAPKHYTGRVVMGYDSPGPDFLTIQEIEGKRHRPVWNEATEEEYIGRCRDKAQIMARDIIAQALAQAAKEAEAIREQGRREADEAVAAARQEAQAQHQAELAVQAEAMSALIAALQQLGLEVWEARRKDFAALARTFTEKALRVEMHARRAEILESLMDEALTRLEAHREFTLKVALQDFELAKTLLEEVAAKRPDLGQWQIAADASLAQGGVVLETSDMLADNGVESRLALLEPYLAQLELPEDQAQAAEAGANGA